MPISVLTPSQQQIDQLRQLFNERYEKSPPEVPFHRADLDRVRKSDIWLRLFLEMYDLDLKVASEKMWTTCIWRQKFGTNDLNEQQLRSDYLNDGVIFPHNKDVDGKTLLIFKTKKHIKGSKDMNEVLRVLIYWIERIQRENNMDKMTLFFDMDGTGLSNMDLEFIKMVIETFKQYYPNALNYILVYEMAWVLNAAFKVVKALLPEKAVEILKTITKKNIGTYVNADNLLASWGGTDNYEFSFVPEVAAAREPLTPAADDQNNNMMDKKVHFANSSPTRVPAEESQMQDIPEQVKSEGEDMLRVSPQDILPFARGDTKDNVIELLSIAPTFITYKIQTTSPEKFRVRPRCGVLRPGESVSVSILLKPEHTLSDNARDKFLVMCMCCPEMEAYQVPDFWKKMGGHISAVEQHRLCCMYKDAPMLNKCTAGNGIAASAGDEKKVEHVPTETKNLEKQLRSTQILQIITLVFLVILSAAVIYLLKLQICDENGCTTAAKSAVDAGSVDL